MGKGKDEAFSDDIPLGLATLSKEFALSVSIDNNFVEAKRLYEQIRDWSLSS